MINLLKSSNNNGKKYWKKLLFTDLHVSSKTLDRTLNVLKKVRNQSCTELLDGKPTPVVFLGDFWHQRDVLHVRHVDSLLKEFEQWKKDEIETILIPGNHDQVSIDGTVHGIQLFSLFPNFTVATNPIFDYENGLAYFPWRETKEDQTQLFKDLSERLPDKDISIHSKWTVFAHAEAKGAVANGGYRSSGKFDLDSGKSYIRSCYLGHYHKRQQISRNYWYIGSPYQQNYGEMNDPHGIAFVDSNRIEPYFIDFEDLPKHHKLIFPFDLNKIETIKSNDFVEIKSTKDLMKSTEFLNFINQLPQSIDLRRVMINDDQLNQTQSTNNKVSKQNKENVDYSNKLKLEDFLEIYINKNLNESSSLDKNKLLMFGKNLLKSINETSIVPIGRKVQIKNIEIEDFCGIEKKFEINLMDEQMQNKMILIRGPMGSGKSTIFEALVWCLYGNTSPKKQSTSSSSIKGDEVINDNSSHTTVTVELLVDDKSYKIKRTKKRGSGSKISIDGLNDDGADKQIKQGIMDQQNLINNIIGLDYESFRMSIYLGQGSISNFVTDSDKRKKELLSKIFNLGVCIPANKECREMRKKKEQEIIQLKKSLYQLESSCNTWKSIDFENQSNQFNQNKQLNLEQLNQHLEKEKKELISIENQINNLNNLEHNKKLMQEIDKLKLELVEFEEKKESMIKQLNEDSNENKRKINDNKLLYAQINQEIKQLNNDLNYCRDYLQNKKCNSCGQTIENHLFHSKKEETQEKIKDYENSMIDKQHELYELTEKNDELYELLSKEEKEHETNMKLIQFEIKSLQLMIQEKSNKYDNLSKSEINIKFLKQSIKDKELRIQLQNQELNPYIEKIQERRENIEKLTKQIENVTNQIQTMEIDLREIEFWETGFNSNGLPMIALTSAVKEVESYANEYLSKLSKGQLFTNLSINDDELSIDIFELDVETKLAKPRSLYQLSGGQRRCLELSYSPFALSEVIYNNSGSRVTFMAIDELTNHLDQSVKPIICDLMRNLQEKDTIFVIDHDISVQSEFDQVFNLIKDDNNLKLKLLTNEEEK